MFKNLRKILGDRGEKKALRFLKQQGLQLITKNYSCYHGEIDIIMRDKSEIVFVEVRYRKNSKFCQPEHTIDTTKQTRLHKAAEHFIQHHNLDAEMRFDVVGIEGGAQPNWIKDAFALEY